VGLAWIEQAHSVSVRVLRQVCGRSRGKRADHNVQCRRGLVVGHDGADRMLGFRPWDMVEQHDRRFKRKIRVAASGTASRSISLSSIANGTLSALWRQTIAITLLFSGPQDERGRRVCGAARALDQLIAVAAAESGDLRADVGDLEDR